MEDTRTHKWQQDIWHFCQMCVHVSRCNSTLISLSLSLSLSLSPRTFYFCGFHLCVEMVKVQICVIIVSNLTLFLINWFFFHYIVFKLILIFFLFIGKLHCSNVFQASLSSWSSSSIIIENFFPDDPYPYLYYFLHHYI